MMSFIVLITWIVTALGGLYLLTIWLIEYDPDYQRAAATRLPIPVLCGHVLFAVAGLGSWVMYLITDKKAFCWGSAGALALIATLGFIMAARWLGLYRARPSRGSADAFPPAYALSSDTPAAGHRRPPGPTQTAQWPGGRARPAEIAVPPERHFPVSVVVAHGTFALTTVTLVVLTLMGIGGS